MKEIEWRWIFAGRLEKKLLEYNMTQRDLAYAIGVTEVTISRYLSCSRTPSILILERIARFFNCTIDELVCVDERINY